MTMNFLELTKTRHSVRDYEDRAVEMDKLDYIMECVRMAPSACNLQPWRFLLLTEEKDKAALSACYPKAWTWIASAPCVIVACGDHEQSWHRSYDGKDHADIDVAIAVEHLCLAAAEQGLGTCWVCKFDEALCREILHLPEHLEPIAILPLGYPKNPAIPEKKRRPVSELLLPEQPEEK